jgi:hypothetical protein
MLFLCLMNYAVCHEDVRGSGGIALEKNNLCAGYICLTVYDLISSPKLLDRFLFNSNVADFQKIHRQRDF